MPLFKSNNQREHHREVVNDNITQTGGAGTAGYSQDKLHDREYRAPPNPSGPGGFSNNDGYTDNHTALKHGGAQPMIPQTQNVPHGQDRTSNNGTGSRFTGKFEAAIGSAIGSQSLKAKGLEKQREAETFNVQAAELSEAERLEAEARVLRERAVAHGADPRNLQPQGAAGMQAPSTLGQGPAFPQGRRL